MRHSPHPTTPLPRFAPDSCQAAVEILWDTSANETILLTARSVICRSWGGSSTFSCLYYYTVLSKLEMTLYYATILYRVLEKILQSSKICNPAKKSSYSISLWSIWNPGLPFLPTNAQVYFFDYHGMGFSSMPPFTRSLTNCFCLQGSMAALWCSNPFLLTKETDGRSRERGRWAATGYCEPDVSLPLSSALVQSALAAQAVVEHLWNHGVCTIVLTVNDFL